MTLILKQETGEESSGVELFIPSGPFISIYTSQRVSPNRVSVSGRRSYSGGSYLCARSIEETKLETTTVWIYSIALLVIILELILIGALSGFHKGLSTLPQRVWIVCWFAFGIFIGGAYL